MAHKLGEPGTFKRLSHSSLALIRRGPKMALWAAGSLLVILLVLIVASFFIDEPMRRYTEQEVNRSLKGYSASIPELHFSLFGFSVTLKDLTLVQEAYPDQPVLYIPRLRASVHWKELLRARFVGEFELDRPRFHINLKQLRKEYSDEVPVKDRGWQEAVQSVYPLKINLLRIEDGEFTYSDEDHKRPLRITHFRLYATNIRNVRSESRTYPSPFSLQGVVFDKGRAQIEGSADFLAEPFPGIYATYKLKNIELDYFKPVVARSNLTLEKGVFSSTGQFEYAPKFKMVHVYDTSITGLILDYIHTAKTAAAEKERVAKARQKAKEVSNKPDVLIRIDNLTIGNSTLSWVNKAANPSYRVFLSDTDLSFTNFSNQFLHGPANGRLRGQFMGSGTASARITFRPETDGPDFDIILAIEGTQMTTMNDLLRAHGKLDVEAGIFSLYSELNVKDDAVAGYVKPLFQDVDVYNKHQDEEKGVIKKLYEGLVEALLDALENRPRDEVATRTDISGRLEDPKSNTLEVIAGLIQNAFFKAILPGFEGGLSKGSRR